MLGPLKTVIHGCVIIDGAPHENKKKIAGKGQITSERDPELSILQ
jgi:hypothetical protein